MAQPPLPRKPAIQTGDQLDVASVKSLLAKNEIAMTRIINLQVKVLIIIIVINHDHHAMMGATPTSIFYHG